jgi:eukaryotic-like serine/threonine-protein kinase
MTDFKELCHGALIADLYTTEECVRQERESAFFTVKTADGERLLMKLVPADAADVEQQFAVWQRSRHLRHRHLLYLSDLGRTEIEGRDYIYAVFENPDDSLASALRHRPLSEAEARATFEAALSALRYLHGQGMVHGAVDADHVVAVGDDVKLTTDALREFDDLDGHLEDVRQLGELGRAMRAPETLSEPMASVVRHATAPEPRQRWTLAEIAKTLEERPAPPAAAAAIEAEAPAAPEPAPIPIPMPMPAPVVEPKSVEPEPRPPAAHATVASEYRNARPVRVIPKWPFAAAALLLLSILVLHSRHKPDSPRSAPVAAVAMRPNASSAVSPAQMDRTSWRVVAFSSRSRHNAARRAQQINRRWPELHAAVYALKERRV